MTLFEVVFCGFILMIAILVFCKEWKDYKREQYKNHNIRQ